MLLQAEHRTASRMTNRFDAGETMDIHLWSSGRAPENSYTVEFKLFNNRDQVVSFGAANPVTLLAHISRKTFPQRRLLARW